MKIERQNILDLIGKNRKKYASCIITCYTFDFTFFEERVMSILGSSNIKNVNIFLDGKYLDHYLESASGNEFKTHKTYSLNPIYSSGVFHPKIMLLTGPKHGLLIIGSGNVTTSGLSTNDEIWGAFHLNSEDSKNAPLFATVWRYLQQYTQKANGFNLHKINWVTKYAPWLVDIDSLATNGFIPIQKGTELKFIGNNSQVNHFQELIKSLPAKRVSKLTIISPYFDEKGKVLEQLHNSFKIEKITCITDAEFGLLPIKLNEKLTKVIPFYDWKYCIKSFDDCYNRLHAKIFHFEYTDGWEYLLIGSANATINAFGSETSPAKNAEAGLLLRRKNQSTFLNDLGIKLKKAGKIDLKSITRNKNNIGDSQFLQKVSKRIIYTEINGNKLTAKLLEALSEGCELNLLNNEGEILETQSINITNQELIVVIKRPEEAYKIYLSINNVRVSNYSLIHNIAYQSKCNPDPVNADLGHLIETFNNDPEQDKFIELLKYVDYNWADEDFEEDNTKSARKFVFTNKTANPKKKYEKITEEEFNELKTISSTAVEHLRHPSIQIADLLNAISRGLITSDLSIQENPEEALGSMIEEEQIGFGEEVTHKLNYRIRGAQEKRAIEKHISRVTNFYQNQLNNFNISRTYTDAPKRPLHLKELSNLSVALDLIFFFFGEKYPYNHTKFMINMNEFRFIEKLLNSFDNKSLDSIKKFVSLYSIEVPDINEKVISETDTKRLILSSLKDHPHDALIDYIRHFEKRYKLERLDEEEKKTNIVTYEINSAGFEKFEEEFKSIDNTLLIHQDEYSINTYFENFIQEGVYNSYDGYGLKSDLIEMLGSFLICANSSAGFNRYDYDLLNGKINSLRKTIFELGTFLCLNINWSGKESITQKLLLLDLLHFVYPEPIQNQDIEKIKKILSDYFDKSKQKSYKYKTNVQYYLNELLPYYLKWNNTFFSDKRSDIIKDKSNALLGKIVFISKIGFALFRGWGSDTVTLEKPGFEWNDEVEGNVLRIKHPKSKIVIY